MLGLDRDLVAELGVGGLALGEQGRKHGGADHLAQGEIAALHDSERRQQFALEQFGAAAIMRHGRQRPDHRQLAHVAGGNAAGSQKRAFILTFGALEIAQGHGIFTAYDNFAIGLERDANALEELANRAIFPRAGGAIGD